MSEVKAIYQLPSPVSLEAFKERKCVLSVGAPDWMPPTAEEVKTLISLMGWSRDVVTKILGDQGIADLDELEKTKQEFSYPAWRLLLIHAGVISCEEELSVSKNNND